MTHRSSASLPNSTMRGPQRDEVLLALLDDEPVAALSLGDGHVVANPFVRTQAAVALLHLRARHISGVSPLRARRRRRFILRPRIA
jgi:hypothetical protein